jgi:hypothetical protein
VNLRVDLILPSEQRSASLFNPRVVVRLTGILIPVGLLALLAYGVTHMMFVKGRLAAAEQQWRSAEPRKAQAIKLGDQFNANRAIRDELAGWRATHVDWHRQLASVQRRVPPNVQVTSLGIAQVLQTTNNVLARVFTMRLQGKAVGAGADADVEALREGLRTDPVLTNVHGRVEITMFAADTDRNAKPEDRVFQIDCRYAPRLFKSETP